MLLKVPFAAGRPLFKHDKMSEMIRVLATHPTTPEEMTRELDISYRVAWSTLRDLGKAEYVARDHRQFRADAEKIQLDGFVLNLRDRGSDVLFKRKHTRPVLWHLAKWPERSLRKIASELHISSRTAKLVVDELVHAGLISEKHICKRFVYEPSDPMLLVPRKAHVNILRTFIATLRVHYDLSLIPAIALFGRTSWGETSPTLEIAVIMDVLAEAAPNYLKQTQLFESVIVACQNCTSQFGALFDVFFLTKEVWINQQLDLLAPRSPKVAKALEGICIHGMLPIPEDLFEMGRRVLPRSQDWIAEKIEKGYLKPIADNRYIYTQKALQRFKDLERPRLVEEETTVHGKKISVLFIGPPS
jgi:hypothetical protein